MKSQKYKAGVKRILNLIMANKELYKENKFGNTIEKKNYLKRTR